MNDDRPTRSPTAEELIDYPAAEESPAPKRPPLNRATRRALGREVRDELGFRPPLTPRERARLFRGHR